MAAENVAVSFSDWTALSARTSISSFGQRSTSGLVPGLPASVMESCVGTGVGVWVRSRSREGSESAGSPIGKGVGKGKPDEARVGGSARLNAPSASWVLLGGDSVTTSRGEESGSRGGMIKGITGSRSPLRPSAMVTGTNSVATITTLGVTIVPLVSLWVTTSSPASVSSSLLVVTSGGGGSACAGVVDGRVLAG